MPSSTQLAQSGDLAYLVGPRGQTFTIQLKSGEQLHSMHGILSHDALIGVVWGSQVLEAGTGSGAMTVALAHAVGPQGHVFSYERRPEVQAVARRNLVRLGLADRVTLTLRDITDGFDETDMQSIFLDLPSPENYLVQARTALQPGGFFGSLLPTTNQVSILLTALKTVDFGLVEVSEILHRYYIPAASRLRPADTMTAHTGFLIFARKLAAGQAAEIEAEEHA